MLKPFKWASKLGTILSWLGLVASPYTLLNDNGIKYTYSVDAYFY